MCADNLIVLMANTIGTCSEYFSTGGWGLGLGNEVLTTFEVVTLQVYGIFLTKASSQGGPSLRKSSHAFSTCMSKLTNTFFAVSGVHTNPKQCPGR